MNKLKNHKRTQKNGYTGVSFVLILAKDHPLVSTSIYPTFPKPSGTVAVAPASRARVAQSLATAVPDARRCGWHSGATRQEALLEAHVFRCGETPKKTHQKKVAWVEMVRKPGKQWIETRSHLVKIGNGNREKSLQHTTLNSAVLHLHSVTRSAKPGHTPIGPPDVVQNEHGGKPDVN